MVNQDQFYEKQLGFAYWYVTHKILLKNILTLFLLILAILLIAYNFYLLIFNFAIFQSNYQLILNNFVTTNSDYLALRQLNLPQSMQIGQIQTFANNENYDIVAELANPNQKWWATFDYQFQIGQTLTDKRQEFILPGQRKSLIDLAIENGNLASQLVLGNIKWQKEINFDNLYKDRYTFDIANIQYLSARELGIGEEVPVNRLTFQITNSGAYNYKSVNFLVFLKAGAQTAAVNQIVAEKILSGQTREISVTFFQALPKITSADIVPEINILDENVFLKF